MSIYLKKKEPKSKFEKNQKVIENHKRIANQLKEAAELHLEAISHLENDDLERAYQLTANAYGFLNYVRDAQMEILKNPY
jgi:predicted transcriptional regulator